ncbi:MAG: hypothetical protein CMK50_05310 [Propionibacteriaceae bacterium]|jgi:hypothetical protein|nr:hypothetical protein [Propionibacteriaceae bacterium]MBT66247.1 hypothetical protein [Synechococcus sp. NP17]|tara:strand:- start:3178 stop:3609 length:432 start_codon:yes stop_codon:yes gene_type:complete
MVERPLFGSGPLSRSDAEQIEATLLPNLDRHHLRLLAHCLRSFQVIAKPRTSGPLPNQSSLEQWLLQQPQLTDEPQFRDLLLGQFLSAALQLEGLARAKGLSPLELSIGELITASTTASKARIEDQKRIPSNCDHPQQETSPS